MQELPRHTPPSTQVCLLIIVTGNFKNWQGLQLGGFLVKKGAFESARFYCMAGKRPVAAVISSCGSLYSAHTVPLLEITKATFPLIPASCYLFITLGLCLVELVLTLCFLCCVDHQGTLQYIAHSPSVPAFITCSIDNRVKFFFYKDKVT